MIDPVKFWVKHFQHDPREMARDVAEAAMREFREGDMDWYGLRDTSDEIKAVVIDEKITETEEVYTKSYFNGLVGVTKDKTTNDITTWHMNPKNPPVVLIGKNLNEV